MMIYIVLHTTDGFKLVEEGRIVKAFKDRHVANSLFDALTKNLCNINIYKKNAAFIGPVLEQMVELDPEFNIDMKRKILDGYWIQEVLVE